jgi:hypothetical protein
VSVPSAWVQAPVTLCAMAEYKEVRVERLFVKVPNTDKLRKTAAGRHRHLLATGWRELERKLEFDHVRVRYERTGHTPLKSRLPKGEAEVPRMDRRPRGQFGGGGRGFGGRGGGRGGPRGGGGPVGRGGPSAGRGAGGRGAPPPAGPQPGGAPTPAGPQPGGAPTPAGPQTGGTPPSSAPPPETAPK